MHVCRHLNREEGQEKKHSGRGGVVGFGDSAGLSVGGADLGSSMESLVRLASEFDA